MKFKFPFEKCAENGSLPDELSLLDAGACARLARIYSKFRADKDAKSAGLEKERLKAEWEAQKRLEQYHMDTWLKTEIVLSECKKHPTQENAIALCDSVSAIRSEYVDSILYDKAVVIETIERLLDVLQIEYTIGNGR